MRLLPPSGTPSNEKKDQFPRSKRTPHLKIATAVAIMMMPKMKLTVAIMGLPNTANIRNATDDNNTSTDHANA